MIQPISQIYFESAVDIPNMCPKMAAIKYIQPDPNICDFIDWDQCCEEHPSVLNDMCDYPSSISELSYIRNAIRKISEI